MHRYSNRIAAILAMSTFSQRNERTLCRFNDLGVPKRGQDYSQRYYVLALELFVDIELNRKNIMCIYTASLRVYLLVNNIYKLYLYTQNGIFLAMPANKHIPTVILLNSCPIVYSYPIVYYYVFYQVLYTVQGNNLRLILCFM
jgi:hypothetical protein